MRRTAEKGADILAGTPAADELPSWLWARWRAIYGDEVAGKIARAHMNQPDLDLSMAKPDEAQTWAEKLGARWSRPAACVLRAGNPMSPI